MVQWILKNLDHLSWLRIELLKDTRWQPKSCSLEVHRSLPYQAFMIYLASWEVQYDFISLPFAPRKKVAPVRQLGAFFSLALPSGGHETPLVDPPVTYSTETVL